VKIVEIVGEAIEFNYKSWIYRARRSNQDRILIRQISEVVTWAWLK